MSTSDIMVTTKNNESNIKDQIIQTQEQEKTNTDNTDFINQIYKSSLFDKLIDIKQKAGDLMTEIDRAIKYLEHIVVLTEEQRFELGHFSYDAYVNALRFAEQVTKNLKKEGKENNK